MYNCRCVYACVHTFARAADLTALLCGSSQQRNDTVAVSTHNLWNFHDHAAQISGSMTSLSPPLSQTDNPVKTSTVADAAVQTDVYTTSHTADFIARVQGCELRPSKVVGWGMVYLNQKQELSYVNHRRKLQAPLSFLETIDENSVLEFVYEKPEQEPCGMVYLNQEQESTYINHRRKLHKHKQALAFQRSNITRTNKR